VSGQPPGDGPSFFVQSLPGSFSDLGPLGREVSLDPGAVLWKEGDPGDHVILLLEGDLARTHPRAALAVLRAVRRGGRLLTLGAVRTQLARLAALHLPVVPGREAEALAGLVAAVRALEGTKGSSPEPADPLRRAALWLAQATRASAILAPMGAEPLDARQAARELATLVAVAGHLGRTGSAILALAARGNLRGSCAVGVLPDRLPGSRGPDDREASQRLGEIWGREPHAADGLDVAAMLERVSALIVVADDPPTALPAGAAARSALGRAHRLIVLDAFRTETAQQAHVVLPIAAFVETDGSVTSAEGRVLRVRAAIAPPGEARPGWRVLTDLLARLGCHAYQGNLFGAPGAAADLFRGPDFDSRQGRE